MSGSIALEALRGGTFNRDKPDSSNMKIAAIKRPVEILQITFHYKNHTSVLYVCMCLSLCVCLTYPQFLVLYKDQHTDRIV